MSEAQARTDDDDDNIDITAQKAAEIGKQLGVEDDNEEIEVIEDTGDARIAKERPEAGGDNRGERKPLSNKEKRDLRKKNLAKKFSEKDNEIAELRAKVAESESWRQQMDQRFSNIDKQKIEQAEIDNKNALAKAEAEYVTAFTEGDGQKAAIQMGIMYDAKENLKKIDHIKQQFNRAPVAPQNNGPKADPKVISKAQAWAAKHAWYKADGSDEDSEIAKAISGKLAQEGMDAKSDEFWDELDARLEKRGIITRDEEEDEDDEELREVQKPAPKKRAAPPVGGGSNRNDVGGKRKVVLPTAYITHLKEKGWWDDIKQRNKMIKAYEANRKNLEAQ